MDIIFILPDHLYIQYNNYQYNGQSALLQKIKQSLQKTYPTKDIGGDGQVVVIEFSDGIKFETVPAFKKTDGTFFIQIQTTGEVGKLPTLDLKLVLLKGGDSDNCLVSGEIVLLVGLITNW